MHARLFQAALTALLIAITGVGATAPAAADTLVWRFKSEHPNSVSLSFYSQDRNHAWPGGDDVYIIDDWKTHSYRLDCRSGETICFGAWVRGDDSSYWGAGYGGYEACDNCCFVCQDGTSDVQVLKP